MYRWKYLLLALVLLLAACSSGSSVEQEPASQPDSLPAQNTTMPERATEELSPEPTNTLASPNLTEEQAEEADVATAEEIATSTVATVTAAPQQATETPATVPPPTNTVAPEINGEYEGTFYLGLATAPITMIDYSDFL
jgi:uncharacterized lipoprotein